MVDATEATLEKAPLFLSVLSETASVTAASKATGLARSTWYRHRKSDTSFADAWDAALELGTDSLEDEAVRRAHEGTEKPVYQGGRMVGTVREYSDTLLIFMLKARRPEKFKDRVSQELMGKGGGPIETKDVSARETIIGRLASLAARRAEA